jgi:HD-GYP domain-containing protein (c-di-GMP phosphodiesterase class II)
VHPFKTYLTLKKGLPFEDIIIWASYHHEKLNGKGYPFKVSGENIPIPARIITISDIYSALLENRPYRPGLSENKVLSYMKRLATENYIDKDILSIILENREEVSSVIKL